MSRISDWYINVTWTVCGVFATGAVWYFASAKDWPNVFLTAICALLTAGLAILLHKIKDSQVEQAERTKIELDRQTLSKNPTKENIERVILESDPTAEWIGHADNERSVYSYAGDVNLRLEMLNDECGVQCEDFREPWANKFPDRRATGYWCNLFYGSTQIDRYILVAVDGARALLPIPKLGHQGSAQMEVLPIEYKVAQIYNNIKSLDQYMKMAELRVAKDAT